jgi:oxygen-independent coproporphyrinogen-3 oxidase
VEILKHWADVWRGFEEQGLLAVEGDHVTLSRAGTLRVDALLPAFFEHAHQGVRYT